MFYLLWFVGVFLAIAITVSVVSKIEKSGFFDKYEDNSKK